MSKKNHSPPIHFDVMWIKEENSCWNQGYVEILSIYRNFINIYSKYPRHIVQFRSTFVELNANNNPWTAWSKISNHVFTTSSQLYGIDIKINCPCSNVCKAIWLHQLLWVWWVGSGNNFFMVHYHRCTYTNLAAC